MKNSSKTPWGNSLNFMWCVDKDFNFISSNHTLNTLIENITGKAILKGNNIQYLNYALLPLNRFKSNCEQAFKGNSVIEIIYLQQPEDKWLEIAYHPIYKYNEIICCACYFCDITDRKITADEISHIKKQLTFQQANLPNLIYEEQNKKTEEINNGIKEQLVSISIDIARIEGNEHSNRKF